MTTVLSVCNQKGGVGKTTTSVNLSSALAKIKKKILLVDLDPQGNATMGSGINKNKLSSTIADLLLSEVESFRDILLHSDEGYDLLPANQTLTYAELKLLEEKERENALKRKLKDCLGFYDFVIIDCPPSLNILTVNALSFSNKVIIPAQCAYYALEGIASLVDTIEKITNSVNSKLQIGGILRTMYDPRNNLARDVSDALKKHFGKLVYKTVIPRNINLAEAPSHGVSVISYNIGCKGALAYIGLAGEIIKRMRKES